MNNPISFTFQENHSIRVELIQNSPWFCLKDVCDTLSIKNASDLLSKQLDEAGVEKIYLRSGGQNRQLTFVNEPNLYRVIFRSNKPEAKQFQDWVFNEVLPSIRKNGSYQSNYSTSEPLNSQQQERVKRLIWCASRHMRFSQSWANGVWYALRAATGTPSPQPFSVDDMPILQQEFERILKISAATHNAVYNFEKEVVRLVIRKRQDIEPVLNDMRLELLNIQRLQSEGRLQLEKWDANELARLC